MEHKTISIEYISKATSELSPEETKIILEAKSAALKAYAPYSEFKVGAAVLLDNGKIISGNNQENAAYPSGLCAERVALFYANAQYPDSEVLALAICAYTHGRFTEAVVTPCGSCRQVINETVERQKHPFKLLLSSERRTYIFENANTLLPLSFGQKELPLK